MGVAELGVQEEAEHGVELHLGVPDLEDELLAALDTRALDHGAQHRIDALAQVLDQHRVPVLERHAELAQQRGLAQPHHLEVPRLLLGADPADALQLRVDHERPARRVAHDRAVLRRHLVGRQACFQPQSQLKHMSHTHWT